MHSNRFVKFRGSAWYSVKRSDMNFMAALRETVREESELAFCAAATEGANEEKGSHLGELISVNKENHCDSTNSRSNRDRISAQAVAKFDLKV
jgi:hypothetical protein